MCDKPIIKLQYPINKSVQSILNWLETEMCEIPSVYYKTCRTDYFAELNDNAIEVHYRMYDRHTKEYIGGDIQFSFVVREFDSSTSVIVGKFYTHNVEIEKLAYTYLAKLGIVVDAKWQAEAARIAAGTVAIDATKSVPPVSIDSSIKNNFKNEVFVSYAWGGESELMVDEFEQAFAKRGIRVVCDKKDLDYKGSIKAFEQSIGQGQCVVLVISDKYLRSEHCMYELVEVDENKNIRDRIFPIVLPDAQIHKAIGRLSYINYWDERIEELNQAIKGVRQVANLSGVTSELDKYVRIRASFDRLTDLLSDMNALTPEIHKVSGFSKLISAVESILTEKKAF